MPAQVRSFEAIQAVRDEVSRFAARASDGVDELAGEIRRVLDWVEHDRPAYWRSRVRVAYDRVAEARANLNRCLMYPINEEAPSCTEEKAALKRAQAHLAYCEEKQRKVHEWARDLRHELHEYDGRIARLKRWVESDAPRCEALLDRTLASLERYASGSPPASTPATGEETSEGSDATSDDAGGAE